MSLPLIVIVSPSSLKGWFTNPLNSTPGYMISKAYVAFSNSPITKVPNRVGVSNLNTAVPTGSPSSVVKVKRKTF